MQWFDVDKEGLAQLIQRRGAASAVVELVQNALDTDATEVDISLVTSGEEQATLSVADNDPHGFSDLAHAFTLFAPSVKKFNPTQRGRFNLGEKLVLALCEWAEVKSTTGTVRFDEHGRTENKRSRRKAGSSFDALIRLTQEDIDQVADLVHRLLLPTGVLVTFNGQAVARRKPETSWRASLLTEVADDDGLLKARKRQTTITLYRPLEAEKFHLYELGIPVVEIDGAFHVNIGQKVPLNMERNNVTPAYLRAVQLSVVNNATDLVADEQAASGWVTDALADPAITDAAVRAIIEAKFGVPLDKLVRYDPSDPQAHREAAAQGYIAIGGRSFNKEQWKAIDRAGIVPAAGKVTPSRPRPEDDTAEPEASVIPLGDLTETQRGVCNYIGDFAKALIGRRVKVQVVHDSRKYLGSFGSGRTAMITLNAQRLPKAWWVDQRRVDELTLSELAHEGSDPYEAAIRLGARARFCEHRLADYVAASITLDAPAAAIKVGIH
jgi:hypothetical protein